MRTVRIKLYKFNELPPMIQLKVITSYIEFEIDTMTEHSIFYPIVKQMEDMKTPWFLAQAIYDKHKQHIIDNIEESNNEFTKEGSIFKG